MNYLNYLKTYQDIPYHIFYNALKEDRLFHAYLLSGEVGTNLEDISKFIASCIISKGDEPFEIKDLNVRKRIFDDNYIDFVFLDAKKANVKIDEIRALEEKFSKTSSEKLGKKVYVINGVENLSVDASNALLKFLEEPTSETYALLLTENEFSILPTIRSRTQIIHFVNINQNELIQASIELGVNENIAELLSFFYNSPESILEASKNKETSKVSELVSKTLSYSKNYRMLLDCIYNDVLKDVTTKTALREYFDYLSVFFKEALKLKNSRETHLKTYDKILKDLASLPDLENAILTILRARNEVNYNLNPNLLIIHTMKNIFGGKDIK